MTPTQLLKSLEVPRDGRKLPGLYIILSHGRKTPDEQLDDWGPNGPMIGPIAWAHLTYRTTIGLADINGNETGPMSGTFIDTDGTTKRDPMYWTEDLLYYGGMHYGDVTLEYFP